MFAKLVLVILASGATALMLLVIRQQQIDTVHHMSQIHHRLREHDAGIWKMRSRIAQECEPERIRARIHEIEGEWTPIPAEPVPLRGLPLAVEHPSTPSSGESELGG